MTLVVDKVDGTVRWIIRTYTAVYGTYGMQINYERPKPSLAFTSIDVLIVSGLRLARRSESHDHQRKLIQQQQQILQRRELSTDTWDME
jgi:hypothetical protein